MEIGKQESTVESVIELTPTVKFLPQSYPFEESKYYVRECYEQYYHYIDDALKKGIQITTLTGTPGIGKSVFYMYFFQRYRNENPDKTIVTASFSKSRVLKKCVVFKPNQEGENFRKEIPFIEDAVHLYDGTPTVEPADNQMVTFMSPNYGWLKEMLKHRRDRKLYMPFWTFSELLEANEVLELGLTDEAIERRYNFFGGSARMCLEVDNDKSMEHEESVRTAIKKIDSYYKVKDYLDVGPQTQEVSHMIFFYEPRLSPYTNLPNFAKRNFCSAQVARLLKGNSECSDLLGWLFEGYCKEILREGGKFIFVPLSDQPTAVSSTSNIKLKIPANTYNHAEKRNYESIDGYYYDHQHKGLYLFQITISYTHPVKGADIIKHLQSMNLVGVIGLKVYLVFVVSKGMNDFKKQEVEMQSISAEHSNAMELPGIGPKGAEKLKTEGFITVQQLQNAFETNQTLQSRYKKTLDAFREIEADKELLNGIHQYLLVTEGDYKRQNIRYTN